jgi:uncharacterized protein
LTRIAILSDSHDNIWNLEKALVQVQRMKADVLLHCGDLVAPFVLDQLAQGFAGPIHVVLGNNDGDGRLLHAIASQYSHVNLHGLYVELEMGDRRIALIHYPEPALRIAQSGHFDLVCYGHDHQKYQEQIGRCYLVNPGEIMGRYGEPGWGLYDGESHTYERQHIG